MIDPRASRVQSRLVPGAFVLDADPAKLHVGIAIGVRNVGRRPAYDHVKIAIVLWSDMSIETMYANLLIV